VFERIALAPGSRSTGKRDTIRSRSISELTHSVKDILRLHIHSLSSPEECVVLQRQAG